MSVTSIIVLCIGIVFLTLAIEAGIQDRIKNNDSTWFAWAGRNISKIAGRRKKEPRTLKSN